MVSQLTLRLEAERAPHIGRETESVSGSKQRFTEAQAALAQRAPKETGSSKPGVSTRASSVTHGSLSESAEGLLTPDAQGNVHEEELQHALLMHLLHDLSPKAAEAYASAFNQALSAAPSFEDCVKTALKKLVAQDMITRDQAEVLNGKSFRAAQLDPDLNTLFDNRGGGADNTIAVMKADAAYKKAEETLKSIEAGEIATEARSLDAPSNVAPRALGSSGRPGGGAGGFLWKPVSESNGNLVVLFPSSLTGNITSASLYSSLPPSSDTLIEQGRFSGDQHNGGRAHYRFSRPGGTYPDGVYVVAQLTDGQIESFQINNTVSRDQR